MCSSSPTAPKFHTLQENEIRVLYLEPGDFAEPLVGELKKASILPDTSRQFPSRPHASVQYEAISYAWESLEKPHSIKIRNTGDIEITKSLFDILRHFRYVHRSRILWVDAICIHQADISERNNQVAIMADIFSASLKVLVWLGAGASTDSLAFATIDVYTSLLNASGSEGTVDTSSSESNDSIDLETLRTALYEYAGPHVSFRRNLSVKEDVVIATLISIFTIFEAKWFQRLWVVQETDAGHNVAYFRGYHEMEPNELYGVLGFLQDNATLIRSRGIRIDCAALWHVLEHVTAYYRPSMHGGEIMF